MLKHHELTVDKSASNQVVEIDFVLKTTKNHKHTDFQLLFIFDLTISKRNGGFTVFPRIGYHESPMDDRILVLILKELCRPEVDSIHRIEVTRQTLKVTTRQFSEIELLIEQVEAATGNGGYPTKLHRHDRDR